MWAQRGISEMKPLSGQGLVRIGGGKKKGFSIILPTRCNTSHPVSSAVPARLSESPRPQTETRSQVPEFPSFFARIQQYRTRILLLAKHNASEFQVITQKHNYGYYIQFLTLYPPKSHTLNIQTVCLEERCLIMEQQISMRITILQIIHTLDYYSVIINEHGESCMFLFFFSSTSSSWELAQWNASQLDVLSYCCCTLLGRPSAVRLNSGSMWAALNPAED